MANPFRSGEDDDLPLENTGLYDTRTIPKYQDSSDDEPQAEPLYDVRTMGTNDLDEEELPPPPPSRTSARPAPELVSAPAKPPRSSLGTAPPPPPSHSPAARTEPGPPLPQPRQRISYEDVPPPPPARRNTAASHPSYNPPGRSGSGPELDPGMMHQMRGANISGSATLPPPRSQHASSKWWETSEQAPTFVNAPWFHKEISRDDAEIRLGQYPLNTYLVRAGQTPGFVLSVRSTEKYMHVRIEFKDNRYYIASHEFTSLQEIVDFYRSHDYAKDHKLGTVCPQPPEQHPVAPATHDYHAPPPPPRDRTATASAASRANMRLPPTPAGGSSDLVFGDTMYVDAEKADAEAERRRKMNVEQLPLARDPRQWNEGEVIRFLGEHGLQAFREPFYSNAITGVRFIGLRGDQFRRGGFSEDQCQALQRAIDAARQRVGL